jgi:hypothetical protein
MRAAARLVGQEHLADRDSGNVAAELERRIKTAAGGNPGLQALLTRPLLKAEMKAAERALAAVEGYLATGR